MADKPKPDYSVLDNAGNSGTIVDKLSSPAVSAHFKATEDTTGQKKHEKGRLVSKPSMGL